MSGFLGSTAPMAVKLIPGLLSPQVVEVFDALTSKRFEISI